MAFFCSGRHSEARDGHLRLRRHREPDLLQGEHGHAAGRRNQVVRQPLREGKISARTSTIGRLKKPAQRAN